MILMSLLLAQLLSKLPGTTFILILGYLNQEITLALQVQRIQKGNNITGIDLFQVHAQ